MLLTGNMFDLLHIGHITLIKRSSFVDFELWASKC